MNIYKKMYYELFNEVTDVIEKLQKIQQKCEEIYISSDEEDEIIDNYTGVQCTPLRLRYDVGIVPYVGLFRLQIVQIRAILHLR